MTDSTVIDLGTWEAQVRTVPPHASFRWQMVHLQYPEKPKKPTKLYTSKLTSHSEEIDALPETEEYDAYIDALADWEEECVRIRNDVAVAEMDFSYDYAVVAFRYKGNEEWLVEPPEEWEPSSAYSRHGVELDESRRITFIFDELLDTNSKMDAVRLLAFPQGDLSTAPIEDEEVSAVLSTFQGRGGSAARNMGGVREASGVRHQDVTIRGRDASSRRQRHNSGWLVQLFTRCKNSDGGN